ncbi:MAG: TolC family protein, partial [bacterium]
SLCAGAAKASGKEDKLTKKVGVSRVRLQQDITPTEIAPDKLTKRQITRAKTTKIPELTLSPSTSIVSSLTIDQAVSTAHKHKPDLQALKYQIKRYKLNEKDAWTGYYPKIGATGTISDDLKGHEYTNVGFKVNQLVFDFSGPQEIAKIAKTNTAIVKLQERAAQNNIRQMVESSYFNCWLLQQKRQAVSLLSKSSRVVYDKAVNSKNVQLLDKKEWLTSAESHAQDISIVHKYDDQVLISQKTLEYLMGYSLNLNLGTCHPRLACPSTCPPKLQAQTGAERRGKPLGRSRDLGSKPTCHIVLVLLS